MILASGRVNGDERKLRKNMQNLMRQKIWLILLPQKLNQKLIL